MKLGIIADIHDHLDNLGRALATLHDDGAERLLCAGDLCAPFIVPQLAEAFAGPIDVVLGNNDGDALLISRQAAQFDDVTLHGPFADLTVDDRRVFLVHYPELAYPIAASGWYDLVCFGHNHTAEIRQDGPTVLVNPGETMGRFGRVSVAIYDTSSAEATHLEVEGVGGSQNEIT